MKQKTKTIKSWRQIPTRISPKLRGLLEDISKDKECSLPVASNILADKIKEQEEEIKKIRKRIPGFDFKV